MRERGDSGLLAPLSIQPLQLGGAQPLAPPPIRTRVQGQPERHLPQGAAAAMGQLEAGETTPRRWGYPPTRQGTGTGWAPSQLALAPAVSLGSGTPLSPASSLGVKTLLSLANHPPQSRLPSRDTPTCEGLMRPPASIQEPIIRLQGVTSAGTPEGQPQCQAQEPSEQAQPSVHTSAEQLAVGSSKPVIAAAAAVVPSASDLLQRLQGAGLLLPVSHSAALASVPGIAGSSPNTSSGTQGISSSMQLPPILTFLPPTASALLTEVRQVAQSSHPTTQGLQSCQLQTSVLPGREAASLAPDKAITTAGAAQLGQPQHSPSGVVFPALPPELHFFLKDAVSPEIAARAAHELMSLEAAFQPASSAPE